MPDNQVVDLFGPALEPEPAEALMPRPGMMSGDVTDEEIRAATDRIRVWCGPHGWRAFGPILTQGTATVQLHEGRLRAALLFDLGPAKLIRGEGDPEEASNP